MTLDGLAAARDCTVMLTQAQVVEEALALSASQRAQIAKKLLEQRTKTSGTVTKNVTTAGNPAKPGETSSPVESSI